MAEGENTSKPRTAQRREPDEGKPAVSRPRSGQGKSGKQKATRKNVRSGAKSRVFQLASTRRAAILALLVCALALSVSVPLRTYLSQQDALHAAQERRERLSREVQQLEQRKRELSDPSRVEAEARRRLGMVRPGETPYVVEPPPPPPSEKPPPPPPERMDKPWYQDLWESINGTGS